MKRLNVTIIDMTAQGPTRDPFGWLMNANYASVMPQAVAVWAEELGHRVNYQCYTGFEGEGTDWADDTDVLFIGAFTYSAQAVYAISNVYRRAGAVTALGGPHARCYPEDAAKYFDYVLGFTGKPEIAEVLSDGEPHRPVGRQISAPGQPRTLPSVRARWKFVDAALKKAPVAKLVPMIGSMGCPYTCSFCIDSTVDYQPLSFEELKADLRFLRTKFKRPRVGWHDPNFGIRFNDYMDAIEEAVPPGAMNFVAESSLSLLSEANLKRLKKNGFIGMLPGIESWYDYGNKSKTTRVQGMEKVKQVADHVNLILDHIPFVQTNFILGLDCDEGPEPFELTKRFLDLAPGAYPAFSLLTAYGRAAPVNMELQASGRVLPTPFHLLDSNHATNVTPANYGWEEFYDLTVDVTRHALSRAAIGKRFRANSPWKIKWLNWARGITNDRIGYQMTVRRLLSEDASFRGFIDGDTNAVPDFYVDRIKKKLGKLWPSLPDGALEHDPNAYSKSMAVAAE